MTSSRCLRGRSCRFYLRPSLSSDRDFLKWCWCGRKFSHICFGMVSISVDGETRLGSTLTAMLHLLWSLCQGIIGWFTILPSTIGLTAYLDMMGSTYPQWVTRGSGARSSKHLGIFRPRVWKKAQIIPRFKGNMSTVAVAQNCHILTLQNSELPWCILKECCLQLKYKEAAAPARLGIQAILPGCVRFLTQTVFCARALLAMNGL